MTLPTRPTLADLSGWVEDFPRADVPQLGLARVLPTDGADETGEGIVVVHLQHAPAAVYLQLGADSVWVATLTARSNDLTGTSLDLIGLGAEVSAAGRLCAYLQQRTVEAASALR
ncbi:hypothetical protein Q9R20_11255 [Microbacterium sp. PRF11]|uniref:hypothetical protein n=1 Tax=Microbacterium sp. PRF11 TaxID=2962593 RepID=UPI0028816FA3|nr:hypothetical protein [Microbacterium sp. PRF11]MDT0117564.1 hypothetical protein [Microbacterium sp. PRF11]